MKVCTKCGVEKAKSEFGKRKDAKDGLKHRCRDCDKVYLESYYLNNRDKALEQSKIWQQNNKDKVSVRNAKWRNANKETQRRLTKAWHDERPEYHRQYRANNKAEISDKRRKYRELNRDAITETKRAWRKKNPDRERTRVTEWLKNNPEKQRRILSKRRAAKINAYVKWANDFFIEQAYELAKLRTELHGIPFEVDHVVPLIGKINGKHAVCGLHVENNLQVIPKTENLRKLNLFWPDMP